MIHRDCFAYHAQATTHGLVESCNALKELQCKNGECGFYKTKEQMCSVCRKSRGRSISCERCRKIRHC